MNNFHPVNVATFLHHTASFHLHTHNTTSNQPTPIITMKSFTTILLAALPRKFPDFLLPSPSPTPNPH